MSSKRKKAQIQEVIDAGAMLYDDFVTNGNQDSYKSYCILVDSLSNATGWERTKCAKKMIGKNFQITGINAPKK